MCVPFSAISASVILLEDSEPVTASAAKRSTPRVCTATASDSMARPSTSTAANWALPVNTKTAEEVAEVSGQDLDRIEEIRELEDKEAAKTRILEQVRGNFRDFLAKRKPGQPFFYSFNPTNTHRKWIRGSCRRPRG